MRMRVQENTHLQVMSLLEETNDSWHPLILVNGLEEETQELLERIFTMHRAPMADVTESVPESISNVGDCVITDDNVVITMHGTGGSFMGMRFETNWGPIDTGWLAEAGRFRYVWFCLATGEQFTAAGEGLIPPMPVLKLEAVLR